jgi:hypothetical protein
MMISVERHSNFEDKSGNLQYSEYWPEHEHLDIHICNCTKEVSIRPEGDPDHISQDIVFSGKSSEFRLASMNFIYRWKDTEGKKPHAPHTYFTFGDEGRSVRIEVIRADYESDIGNPKKAFFGNLYLGRQIDTSSMMNGHSESRVVNLSKIGLKEVWMHTCCFGNEAMEFIPEQYAVYWRYIFERTQEIYQGSSVYLSDFFTPVRDLHEKIQSNTRLSQLIQEVEYQLGLIAPADSFQKTDIFTTGARLSAKVKPVKTSGN